MRALAQARRWRYSHGGKIPRMPVREGVGLPFCELIGMPPVA